MTYKPPDSVVVDRIKRTFPPEALREHARENLVERERKFDIVALFYTLSLGFVGGSDRSVEAFRERFVAVSDCDKISYTSFRNWFSPAFVAFLRELLDEAIENLDPGRNELRGRLEHFREVLLLDATFIDLYQDASDVYAGFREGHAGGKLHVTESLATGLPTEWETTDATKHERSQLSTGDWVADSLVLFDLGFYDFWVFDRIDANDGWFVSRVKSNANPEIVEELRTWRGNAITLEGKTLKEVLDDLQRQEIDVLVELEFDRKRGSSTRATRQFRLVGLLNEQENEYHLYFTNLPRETYSPADIAQLYRARWEIELLFKELKSYFGIDEINATDPYIIEALILMAAISLMISRAIVDELHKLDRKQRETVEDADEPPSDLPRRRCSIAIKRHSYLIHLYLMLDLGYNLPDLDELLLQVTRDPNPHRSRLREEVESNGP